MVLFKEAILHKGFALVDVLQVCVTYCNMYEYYDKRVYELTDHNPADYDQAEKKIREWDYNKDAKIALGVFYKKDAPTFEEGFAVPKQSASDRDAKIKKIMDEAV